MLALSRQLGTCCDSAAGLNAGRYWQVLLELIQTKLNYVVQEAIVVIKDIFRRYPNKCASTPHPMPNDACRQHSGSLNTLKHRCADAHVCLACTNVVGSCKSPSCRPYTPPDLLLHCPMARQLSRRP